MGILVAGRALQGVGAALLLPGTLAVITRAFPGQAEQAHAVGIWAGVSALALPAGPLLGGALVSGLGWRAVFLVNLPIIAVAIPATIRLIHETKDPDAPNLDVPGMVLAAVTLGTSVYAVITSTWPAGVVAAAALAGFLAWERKARNPYSH
ncbi:hypothetical protein GCM10029964_036790 [Kibdelosporangium lantanae]